MVGRESPKLLMKVRFLPDLQNEKSKSKQSIILLQKISKLSFEIIFDK